MASNLKRIEEYLTRAGATVQGMEHALVAEMPVPDENATVPFMVFLDEVAPDLFRVELRTAFDLPGLEDQERMAVTAAIPLVTSDLDVSRVSLVMPEIEDALDDTEVPDAGAQEPDAELADVNPERIMIAATCYLPGLKPNHAKILLTYVQAFVEDAYDVRVRLEVLAEGAPALFGDLDDDVAEAQGAEAGGGAGPQGG